MAVRTAPRDRRRVEMSAVVALVPVVAMLPFSLLALVVIWLPIGLVTGLELGVLLAAFVATGPLLFLRPFQSLVLTPVLGARAPTPAEEATIAPLWSEIVRAGGLDDDRYVVRILPSDELNAFACGGHLVVVTSFAVEELSTPELQGVLAHELSHHLGLHTVAITIVHWLSLPVVVLARIGVFLEQVAVAARQSYGRDSPVIGRATDVAAVAVRAVSWVFTSGLDAGVALGNVVGHRSEFDADQRAVRLGFGRQLASALRRVLSTTSNHRPVGWRERIATSHPAARTRVARIEALLRHPARPDVRPDVGRTHRGAARGARGERLTR
ncbi:M48 family metalloprotease [Ilumatobacter sp.]|uniref:M48 family metalloprotease n=1 Tax=Ilumatobacter sp. TaxID=1967498 RepID=UPI003B523698